MITKCILLYALIINNFAIGITPTVDDFKQLDDCDNYIPGTCYQYATLLVEHFEVEDIETAVKVMWCESRNKSAAYRWQDQDSGLFQIIPSTWGWVKEHHNIPYWDYPIGNTYAQFIPAYNIEVAGLLVADMHSRGNYWQPWDASKDCWEDTDKWIAKWKSEVNKR